LTLATCARATAGASITITPAISLRTARLYATTAGHAWYDLRPVHRRQDFHYDLPEAQIAQVPADRRDASRLLHLRPDGTIDDARFTDIVELVPPDAILVVNDTRVIPARVHTRKETGGNVELLFVEPTAEPNAWRCLARARRAIVAGQRLHPCVPGKRGLAARGAPVLTTLTGRDSETMVTVAVPDDALAFLETWGEIPLPHYIGRTADAPDRERYQTVFAAAPGAVAAPTAGLHFTPALLAALEARGVTVARVTLHVGLGTFSPIRVDDLAEHVMHRERYDVPAATAALIATGRPVVAVGTTVVRTLESAATAERTVAAGPGETRLFIRPDTGFRFRVVDHLITNFHLPESTLLMLVCAFAGPEPTMRAYAHAVAAGYRFFSYGDAMLCHR
jgi:S-adenosylmethionine:tRNA ribosyltransferase-isomerase